MKNRLTDSSFKKIMHNFLPLENSRKIAIAVSGGADSMSLAILLNIWCKNHNIPFVALTIDHGLRIESRDEAKFVNSELKKRNIEHHTISNETPIPSSNLQENARRIRYQLLTNWCKNNDISHLATAHHLDDYVETFLMRLERGSGVDGLSSIADKAIINDLFIIRPLLSFPKSEIIEYLNSQKQKWIEDPSNQKMDFKRNRIRKALGDDLGDDLFIKRMASVANNMARARQAIETQTNHVINQFVKINQAGFCTIDCSIFSEEDEIILRLLSSVLRFIGGKEKSPRFEKLMTLFNTLKNNNKYEVTLSGCEITKLNNRINIFREVSDIQRDIKFKNNNNINWDNRFLAKTNLFNKFNIYLGALGQTGFSQIKSEYKRGKNTALPTKILYTFPAFKEIDNQGVENIIYVPHINYCNSDFDKNDFICDFKPLKPLATKSFGFYNK